MKLAVLLLSCTGAPRVTDLSRAYVHRIFGHVAGFYLDQSGGRENTEFRVFDWFELPQTSAQWNALGFGAGPVVRPLVENGLHVDLSPFDHFALVIDKTDAHSAAVSPSNPSYVHVSAQDLTPALVEHECGHFFGADHANLDTPAGPVEYGDAFCVMGGEGNKYTFLNQDLRRQLADGTFDTSHSLAGPGMAAPTLRACGWLNLAGNSVDLSGALTGAQRRATVTLGALRGAPGPGVSASAVAALADGVVPNARLLLEYRRRDGWDRGMPQTAFGWVVAHLTGAEDRSRKCLQIGAVEALPGKSMVTSTGALRIAIRSASPAGVDLTAILADGRRRASIAWHNSSTNETQLWFMDGERIKRRATVLSEQGSPALVGPPWRIVATGHMNGDGASQIVWHNSSTNETQLWFMDGERIKRRATVLSEQGSPALVGPPWRIVATGDLNGDGASDIVWHNSSTNETQLWFMDGERIKRRATVLSEQGSPALVGPPWRIVATGDMSGDGTSDIVWHNSSTNETQLWFMDGERIKRRATVWSEQGGPALVGPPWQIVATGDMSGDGASDIVWHNSSTNETQVWFMDGERINRRATVQSEQGTPALVGPPWRIAATGDMNPDGTCDIVWHNSSTNDLQFWFMDGPKIKGRNGVVDENGTVIRIGPPWIIAGVNGEATESAILWHNASTNDLQFWFMDGPKIKGRNGIVAENGVVIQIGPPWIIAGVAGNASESAILWHNASTSDLQFWFMDGPKIKGRNGIVDENGAVIRIGPPWIIAGVTGNASESAILWHNASTNDLQIWFMDGPKIKGRNGIVAENGAVIQIGRPWNIARVTGDATESAILWHNTSTNDLQFWFMDGPKIKGRNGIVDENGVVIQIGPPWIIAGAVAART